MQLVKEHAHFGLFFVPHDKVFEPRMRKYRVHGLKVAVKHHVHWMRWHNEMDRKVGVEQQVFNRMHRDARPRTNIDIAVVQRVRKFIERRPMQEAVDPVEMKAGPDGQQHKKRDEPHGITREQH